MPIALETNPTPLLEDVRRPLSGDSPAGEDVTYDETFQLLKAEIDRLSSASTEGVDYPMIVEKSREVLGRKAKDLRVSSYLGLALFYTNGFRGLLEGLVAQKLLVEQFWEAMHPPLRRMPARRNALQFLAERLAEAVERATPGVEDRTDLEEAIQVVQALQAFTLEAMEDQAPLLSGLRKALEDALRRAPRPAAPEPPPPVRPAPAAPEAGRPDVPAAPPPAAAPARPEDAEDLVLQAANFLQARDAAAALPYRLLRLLRWEPLVALPPNDNGTTRIEAPPPHRRTYLNTLAEGKSWAMLLEAAEGAFQEHPFPFWLDLQRLVATAMDGLGAEYQQARRAVLVETALLLERLPRLTRLAFSDGTPFADPATRLWIEGAVEPVLAAGASPGPAAPVASGDGEALENQFEEAQQRLGQGDLGGALALLQHGTRQDGSTRSRFRRRLYLAVLCVKGNQPALACPLLEALSEEVDTYRLHDWEPGLALEVWRNLYRCYTLLAGETPAGEAYRMRARVTFDRICRVDVTEALQAEGF